MNLGKRQSKFAVKSGGTMESIGKYEVPGYHTFIFEGEDMDPAKRAKAHHRRDLYLTLAGLFADDDGLINFDFLPQVRAVWCHLTRSEEYVLSLLSDLRQLGYLQRTQYEDMPFLLASEEEAADWREHRAAHKTWLKSRAA
jgi:hypothetical protein